MFKILLRFCTSGPRRGGRKIPEDAMIRTHQEASVKLSQFQKNYKFEKKLQVQSILKISLPVDKKKTTRPEPKNKTLLLK